VKNLIGSRLFGCAKFAVATLGITIVCSSAHATWVKKEASSDWTWCEDYVYATATYVVACEPSRECEVGTGVFAFGGPLGGKTRFSGQREIWVLGIGSIHMRAADGKGSVKVALMQKGSTPISTPPISW
jgi:hypothetical protein